MKWQDATYWQAEEALMGHYKANVPQFFAANVLPEITATRGILARTSTALMDLDDDAF